MILWHFLFFHYLKTKKFVSYIAEKDRGDRKDSQKDIKRKCKRKGKILFVSTGFSYMKVWNLVDKKLNRKSAIGKLGREVPDLASTPNRWSATKNPLILCNFPLHPKHPIHWDHRVPASFHQPLSLAAISLHRWWRFLQNMQWKWMRAYDRIGSLPAAILAPYCLDAPSIP